MQKEQTEQETQSLPDAQDGGTPRERTPPKDSVELKRWIEALLFAAGRYMTLAELKEMCAVEEPDLIRTSVREMREDLKARKSPLTIVGEHDAWKLGVVPDYLPVVEGIMPEMELDKPLLETLAVIAWRQPILQSEVVKIRSTGAYDHIQALLDKNLITRERYGRSFVLKTTKQFDEYFELPGKEAARKLFAGIEGELEKSMKKKERMGDLTVYESKGAASENAKEDPHIELYFEAGQEEPSDEGRRAGDQEREEREAGSDAGHEEEPEEADEQESDEQRAQRIIEELAREDEQDQDATAPSDDDDGGDEEELHPAIERFADKVPLPKTEAKAEQGKAPDETSDDAQDKPKEEEP